VQVGGNGFISAFVAGLAFGGVVKGACSFVYEFTESEGQLLTWAAFLLLGAALVPEAVAHLTWQMLALILLSLFVVRPLAIWVSLIGTDAAPITRLFFGWFGPRGLATALFALLVVEQISHEFGEQILHVAVNAVWISAVLHGLSAAPAAKWYGAKTAAMGDVAEMRDIEESTLPTTPKSH
jgi:NhaP-type Na+/H+ or K+/H+ antiporter